jgi:hypothetical protein
MVLMRVKKEISLPARLALSGELSLINWAIIASLKYIADLIRNIVDEGSQGKFLACAGDQFTSINWHWRKW